MKLTIVLMAVVIYVGCATNQEVSQAIGASSAREVVPAKAVVQLPDKPAPATTTTTTIPVDVESNAVKILYFFVAEINIEDPARPTVCGTSLASVKLAWVIINAYEKLTRLDDSWVPSVGYTWVHIPIGVEVSFRLAAFGANDSSDTKGLVVLVK